MRDRLMAAIRAVLGLSQPEEQQRMDARLQAIDERIRVEVAGDRKLRKRRSTDR